MRDLEIRGAGNLLGTAQSGHISAVGFDLYCQLLKTAGAGMKGQKTGRLIETKLQLDFLVWQENEVDEKGRKAEAIHPHALIPDSRWRTVGYRRRDAASGADSWRTALTPSSTTRSPPSSRSTSRWPKRRSCCART